MQRLEELMQWQRQQQGKLLRHQEEQKALMNLEHKRLQEEIGLDSKDRALGSSDKSMQDFEAISVKGVEEIMDYGEEVPQTFDDLPVNPMRKSFNELLQEKLVVNEVVENDVKQKPKRPFLRKGEGLARFRLGGIKRTKPVQPKKKSITDKNSDSNNASKGTTVSSTVTVVPSSREKCERLSPIHTEKQLTNACWSHALQRETSSPRLPEFSKDSEDSGREQDELRVFELLEQHAANSSFCSTSSVVTRLLGEPVKMPTKKVTFISPVRSSVVKDAKPNKLPNNVNPPDKSGRSQTCRSKVKPHLPNIGTNPGLRPCALSKHPLHDFSEFPRRGNPFFGSSHNNIESKQFLSGGSDSDHGKQNCQIGLSYEHIRQDHSNGNGAPIQAPTSVYVLGKENTIQPTNPVQNHSVENESSKKSNNVRSGDGFGDSQAWSDCSYSSSDETLSGNECPAPAPLEKEKTVSESVGKVNVPDPLAQHREVITFKSALLKERLTELENEIEIFKKENADLRKLKRQYENDVANFKKEKKEYEKLLKENTEKMQESILAERKKLAKEKAVFEKYCKDMKNQPNKQEREEIKALKQQVADLQEELIRKDQRWSATQVRTRDRMRQLNRQLAILKEENDKLKAEKSQVKRVRFLPTKRSIAPNTRILHSVNEKLGKLKMEDMETPIVIKHVVPKKRIPDKVLCQNPGPIKESELVQCNLKEVKMSDQIVERFSEEENSSDNEEDCGGGGDNALDHNNIYRKIIHRSNEAPLSEALIYNAFYPSEHESLAPSRGREENVSSYSQDEEEQSSGPTIKEVEDGIIHIASDVLHSTCKKLINDESAQKTLSENSSRCNIPVTNTSPREAFVNDNSGEEIILEKVGDKTCSRVNVVENLLPDGTREKKYSDGRREIWYPNGNVKKLSADNLITKMIYYNGDVKEKYHVDGTEKYYYSETKAWQTTYSDGREILEFPDGQIETKMPNGQRQITYPNGCSLLKNVDGSEEWSLADGTIVKKSVSGEQELLFPNGQREIHTSEHKRREYPDGTVKYIYPDGTQETRYASGRVRIKDKDGNLIMDSSVR